MLKVTRTKPLGLWSVPLKNIRKTTAVANPQEHPTTIARVKMTSPAQYPKLCPTTNAAEALIKLTSTKRELVQLVHTYCFLPVISTCVRAINNRNYASFPGITSILVSRYLPIEPQTLQGYTHKRKQGIRCTTSRAAAVVLNIETKVHEALSKVIELPALTCTY